MEAFKKILRTPSAFVLLLVAIVSLAGVIIKSETDKAIARIPIEATATAEARLTEISLLPIATTTNISLSPTWTTAPVVTETPHLLPSATLTAENDISTDTILLQDDFIDNRNGWLIQDEQGIKSNIVGGKYRHIIVCPQAYQAYYCGYYFQVPQVSAKDVRLEIDATMKNLSPAAEVMISFQIRRNAGNYYTIYFRSTGKYTVNLAYNSSLEKLLDETVIPSFDSSFNRYGFSISNTYLIPLLNGQELLSAEDGNINRAGLIYIAIFVSRGASATIELDNLMIADISNK